MCVQSSRRGSQTCCYWTPYRRKHINNISFSSECFLTLFFPRQKCFPPLYSTFTSAVPPPTNTPPLILSEHPLYIPSIICPWLLYSHSFLLPLPPWQTLCLLPVFLSIISPNLFLHWGAYFILVLFCWKGNRFYFKWSNSPLEWKLQKIKTRSFGALVLFNYMLMYYYCYYGADHCWLRVKLNHHTGYEVQRFGHRLT